MGEIFLKLLNMSIAASWLILAVMCLRLIFRTTPKWTNCMLWGVVALRLMIPFFMESPLSLIPETVSRGEVVSKWADDYIGEVDIYHPDSVYYDAAIGAGREPISDGEGGYYVVTKHDQLGEPSTVENTVVPVLSVIWFIGMLAMLLYAAISYMRLRNKVAASLQFEERTWYCDDINTPFILGIIRPRIYLPSTLNEEEKAYIIAHEKAHLSRKDHIWKPLGYLLLSIYWFNPLCWLAYILLCKDIELACDEKVIRHMNFEDKKNYSKVLLSCATQKKFVSACPLAFGEVGVKERVKGVLNYKKPAFWITIAAIVVCVIVAICFLTDPVNKNEVSDTESQYEDYDIAEVQKELDRVISTIGLENAYPWNNTVEFAEDADFLIKMIGDETGRYEIYGVKTEQYGTYGLLLVDWIDGEPNINYAYEPWVYTGAPSEQPTFELDKSGEYMLNYVYDYDKQNQVPLWRVCVLDCGYDTGHMELKVESENIRYGETENPKILTEPPTLKLQEETSSNREYYEVNSSNYTWTAFIEEGEFEGVPGLEDAEASTIAVCGDAPTMQVKLQGPECWLKLPDNKQSSIPYALKFEVAPDYINVKVYDLLELGDVEPTLLSENTYEDDTYFIELEPRRIYDIQAVWKEENLDKNGFSGEANYAFGVSDERVTSYVEKVDKISTSEISSIVVINGNTGERISIHQEFDTSKQDYYYFNDLIKLYKDLNFEVVYEKNTRVGYQYCMKLQDADGNTLQSITPYKDGVIVDHILYKYKYTDTDSNIPQILMEYLEHICYPEEPEILEPFTEVTVNNFDNVTMTMDEYSTGSGKLVIDNETRKNLSTGEWYDIQKWEDGAWQRVEQRIDAVWKDVLYVLPAGQSTILDTEWKMMYGELPPGKYRILKEIYENSGDLVVGTYYLSTEFEIEE